MDDQRLITHLALQAAKAEAAQTVKRAFGAMPYGFGGGGGMGMGFGGFGMAGPGGGMMSRAGGMPIMGPAGWNAASNTPLTQASFMQGGANAYTAAMEGQALSRQQELLKMKADLHDHFNKAMQAAQNARRGGGWWGNSREEINNEMQITDPEGRSVTPQFKAPSLWGSDQHGTLGLGDASNNWNEWRTKKREYEMMKKRYEEAVKLQGGQAEKEMARAQQQQDLIHKNVVQPGLQAYGQRLQGETGAANMGNQAQSTMQGASANAYANSVGQPGMAAPPPSNPHTPKPADPFGAPAKGMSMKFGSAGFLDRMAQQAAGHAKQAGLSALADAAASPAGMGVIGAGLGAMGSGGFEPDRHPEDPTLPRQSERLFRGGLPGFLGGTAAGLAYHGIPKGYNLRLPGAVLAGLAGAALGSRTSDMLLAPVDKERKQIKADKAKGPQPVARAPHYAYVPGRSGELGPRDPFNERLQLAALGIPEERKTDPKSGRDIETYHPEKHGSALPPTTPWEMSTDELDRHMRNLHTGRRKPVKKTPQPIPPGGSVTQKVASFVDRLVALAK